MTQVPVSVPPARGDGPVATKVRPYAGLAPCYDRLVGAQLHPVISESFDHCVQRLGLSFRSVADVGCGTGRFLRHLSRYGVPMIGVDKSPEMLRIAARRLQGTEVLLSCQDIRGLRLPHEVDLITCNGDTLNYLLEDADVARALGACRDNLSPRGHLVVDLLTGVPPKAPAKVVWASVPGPGTVTRWRSSADRGRRLTRVEVMLGRQALDGWRWAREVHVQRWYPIPWVLAMLEDTGLHVVQRLTLEQGGPPTAEGAWVKLVARVASAPGALLDHRRRNTLRGQKET